MDKLKTTDFSDNGQGICGYRGDKESAKWGIGSDG
jgi:hypothetical protein